MAASLKCPTRSPRSDSACPPSISPGCSSPAASIASTSSLTRSASAGARKPSRKQKPRRGSSAATRASRSLHGPAAASPSAAASGGSFRPYVAAASRIRQRRPSQSVSVFTCCSRSPRRRKPLLCRRSCPSCTRKTLTTPAPNLCAVSSGTGMAIGWCVASAAGASC